MVEIPVHCAFKKKNWRLKRYEKMFQVVLNLKSVSEKVHFRNKTIVGIKQKVNPLSLLLSTNCLGIMMIVHFFISTLGTLPGQHQGF